MATTIAMLVIAFFESLGIFTSQHDVEGKAQRTTGRVPGGLAFYATSPRPEGRNRWSSKDKSRGGTKALAVINHPAVSQLNEETGELEQVRPAAVEYVDVLFPQVVSYAKGDHILCQGQWVAGASYMGTNGPSKYNDSLFVNRFAIIPAAVRESAKLATITVSEPTPVETAPSIEQSAEAAAFVTDVQDAVMDGFEAAVTDMPRPARRRSGK